jgi:hypothetical protein
MKNCNKDFSAFYRDEVALAEAQRTEMRTRRDANRKSLKSGLKRDEEPTPVGSESQGSYAMRTMIQHPENDYDIDDGVYFKKAALVGPNGGDKTSAAAKEMVRKALHSDAFNTPVSILKNCVRILYNAGYHVDVPVYRKVEEDADGNAIDPYFELASSDWKWSDPLQVTKWFNHANSTYSTDKENGGQIRRLVRFLKKFSQSRASWKGSIAPGFMITKILIDNYQGDSERDDLALRKSMRAMKNALNASLVVDHPVLNGETITNGDSDARAKFFREKLEWALGKLEILDKHDCSREDALKAWDSVFNTNFFSNRLGKTASEQKSISAAILRGEKENSEPTRAVSKGGKRRYG